MRAMCAGESAARSTSDLGAVSLAVFTALCLYAVPAAAQEWSGGSMNPATVSGPMATQAAAEAQVDRQSKSRRKSKGSPARSREICTDARSKVAAGDESFRLSRLLALCTKGGY